MERLIEGFKRFSTQYFQEQRARFERLAERGQRPRYAIVTCSDSRIDTTRIFDAVPGEIFLIRNIANLVAPYHPDDRQHSTSAAIEYAVRFLKVGQFVVLGHAGCGGISALLDPPQQSTDFVASWLETARPARERVLADTSLSPEQRQRQCELESLKASLDNVLRYPWVASGVADGSLAADAMYLDLERGELLLYDRRNDAFEPV
ncbi:MAG: carbonic anhydrase [Betaproteobacteria bacterium]|nr:carbonic anhydrase [Betaproteobacteria bacterium]